MLPNALVMSYSDIVFDDSMSLSNMSIEGGARAGMVAPDEVTFEYLKGRPLAPKGEDWDKAVAYWRVRFSTGNDLARSIDKPDLCCRADSQV